MGSGSSLANIKPYIDLNWYTVPLQGELKRLPDGSKSIPSFPVGWRTTYSTEFNNVITNIGGVITGKLSGIVAIDCDNETAYNIFKALDPEYSFVFLSLGKTSKSGKPKVCGTFIYKYEDELDCNFIRKDSELEIDFYSNNGFIYLATEDNKTKYCPTELPELKHMPATAKAILLSWKKAAELKQPTLETAPTNRLHLHHLIARLVANKTYMPDVFKIITPKDFRTEKEYLDTGSLNPDNVPAGRGSEYLSKVSAILGADESIDEELYLHAMAVINSLFSDPLPKPRLTATILEPMVEEKAMIDGVPIWRYNENWQANRVLVTDKRNNLQEAVFDPKRDNYYLIDQVNKHVKQFDSDADIVSHIEAIAVTPIGKRDLKSAIPLVNVSSTPKYEFGLYEDKGLQCMNTFNHSMPLTILNKPEIYAATNLYQPPKTILKYLETLVPDNLMRHYLVSFMKRKLMTFDYSPIILYFLGVSGSGKDTFVELLKRFIGSDYIAKPSAKEFLEMSNGWMLDKYFTQLDEYGNQLVNYNDKENALGKIKTYTGSPDVQIRKMRTDGFYYQHNITFVMTANKNPMFFDDDDRRVALFNCPNCLKLMDWVIDAGGMVTILNKMWSEINDFAYYLATEVDMLTSDEYNTPPNTLDKRKMIANSYGAAQRLQFILKNSMFDQLLEVCVDYDKLEVLEEAGRNRIYEETLFDLYYEMTDGKGTRRALSASMKDFQKVPTTKDGRKSYYYNIPKLSEIKIPKFNYVHDPEVKENIDL